MSEYQLEPVRVRVLERDSRTRNALALRGEARTVAVAAVGGVVLGAATVATVRALAKHSPARLLPGRRRRPKVVASRSFLVDVHMLGR